MSEVDTQNQSTEAKGAAEEEAKPGDESAKGTSDASATVHGEDSSNLTEEQKAEQAANELKYSEATLAAERETAEKTGFERARSEDSERRKARFQDVQRLIKENDGDRPAVIRAVRNALGKLPVLEDGQSFVDADFEPIIKTVSDAMGIATDAALATVNDIYIGEINRLFEKDDERRAFWDKAQALDPTMHVSDILDLLIEDRALGSKRVHDAEPDDLIKANPKLRSHISKLGDEKFKAGREQGRKDPAGDRQANSEANPPARSNGSTSPYTTQEAATLPVAEIVRRRKEAASRS